MFRCAQVHVSSTLEILLCVPVQVSWWNIPFLLPPLKGTSIQITLSNYSCLNTTTITMTCATYNSDALVWIVGQDVKSFLLRAANAIQYFNSTYSGVNCTAYRRLVNVTNQIIESEIICKIIGGLSYPLHFVCKSNDDNADYCSSLLETIHCYDDMIGVHYVANKGQENQTSVNSIQIKAIVIPGAGNCLICSTNLSNLSWHNCTTSKYCLDV